MLNEPGLRGASFALAPHDDFVGLAAGKSRVLARYFCGVQDVIRDLGGDPDEVLAVFGIDPLSFLDPESHIECARALPLIEECSFLLDDPYFGLDLADRQEPGAYGYLTPLCRAAPDLRGALRAFAAYVPVVISPEGMFELLEGGTTFEIRWDCGSGLRQNLQGNLHGAAILMKLLRSIIGEDFRPLRVNLPDCWRGKHVATISGRFGCEVRMPAGNYGSIVFPAEYGSRPMPDSNRLVFDALERPLAAIRQQIAGDLSSRVRAYVRKQLASPGCTIDDCACALGISARTLQKHLARIGTSFSSVLEEEKCEMAKAALQRSAISLDELAYRLGYAEQSTFGRAFRRWTGMTPGEFRQSMRQGAPGFRQSH